MRLLPQPAQVEVARWQAVEGELPGEVASSKKQKVEETQRDETQAETQAEAVKDADGRHEEGGEEETGGWPGERRLDLNSTACPRAKRSFWCVPR